MSFAIEKEIKSRVKKSLLEKHSKLNLVAIKAVERRGLRATAVLLKNNLFTVLFESPIYSWFRQGEINRGQFLAGARYMHDCNVAFKDNAAKPTYDPSYGNRKPTSKEPTQRMIDASRRVAKAKIVLTGQKPIYNKKLKRHEPSKAIDLATLFLEQEKSMVYIKKKLRMTESSIKKQLKEVLGVLFKVYY